MLQNMHSYQQSVNAEWCRTAACRPESSSVRGIVCSSSNGCAIETPRRSKVQGIYPYDVQVAKERELEVCPKAAALAFCIDHSVTGYFPFGLLYAEPVKLETCLGPCPSIGSAMPCHMVKRPPAGATEDRVLLPMSLWVDRSARNSVLS